MRSKTTNLAATPASRTALAPWASAPLGAAFLLVVATVVAYQPVWHAGFIWDDSRHITQNPMLVEPNGLKHIWFSRDAPQYYPLVWTSFRLEQALWEFSPAGYHWVNILLHAANAVLVWRVLRRLGVPGAWLAGALFALHPVNVESVAWVSQRKNTLAMLFYLLSLLWFLRFEPNPRPSNKPQTRWYWLSLAAFVLALLSKTAVAPLPLVLLGLTWWRQGRIERKDVWRSVPFFAAALILGLVTIWFERDQNVGEVMRSDSFWSRLAVAGGAVWFYLSKVLLPVHLMPIYPVWKINSARALSYLPGLLVVAGFLFCWRFRRTWGKAWLLGAGYFVVMLLPVLGFVNIGFMSYSLVADHWQYFSIIGPIALASAELTAGFGLSGKPRAWLVAGLGGVLVLGLGLLTWRQSTSYINSETYWRMAVAANPDSARAENNLGAQLLSNGQTEEALAHLKKAVEINPADAMAHCNLGAALDRKGQTDEAISQYQEALRLTPDAVDPHNNLGAALEKKGQTDEAVSQYQEALRLKPDAADPHYNLGNVFRKKGELAEAIGHYRRALKGSPDHAEAHFQLGNALLELKQPAEAQTHFRAAARFGLSSVEQCAVLASDLAAQGLVPEAVAEYQKVLRLRPDWPEVLNNLAWTLATHPTASLRDGVQAGQLAGRACALTGYTNCPMLQTLAAAQAECGRFSEATATARLAYEVALRSGNEGWTNTARQRLELYTAHKPLRTPN